MWEIGEAVDEGDHRVVPIGIAQITEEESHTMTEERRMALAGLLRKAQREEDGAFLRQKVRCQAFMEPEMSHHPGAER